MSSAPGRGGVHPRPLRRRGGPFGVPVDDVGRPETRYARERGDLVAGDGARADEGHAVVAPALSCRFVATHQHVPRSRPTLLGSLRPWKSN